MRGLGMAGFLSALGALWCSACIAPRRAPAVPSAAPGTIAAEMEADVDRPGADYRDFDLTSNRPEECREACLADSNCSAFTYVHSGIQGSHARCWLKGAIAPPVGHRCCVSGVKRYVGHLRAPARQVRPPAAAKMPTRPETPAGASAAAAAGPPAAAVPAPVPFPAPVPASPPSPPTPQPPSVAAGPDWSELVLPEPSPESCRDACVGDEQCRGYTYVNPGIDGPKAHCLLKRMEPGMPAPAPAAAAASALAK